MIGTTAAVAEYTVPLALEDFVPVVLTGIGLLVVARWNAARKPGWLLPGLVGAALVVVGGLAKASWKLAVALSDGAVDLVLLDRSLFVLLAPGYVLVLAAVATPRRRSWHVALAVLVGGVGLAGASGLALDWDATRLSLLAIAALASIVLSVLLAVRSRRVGAVPAAWLFAAHALLVVVLGGLGRAADPSVTMQWVDQLTNTVAQAGFLVAALRLSATDGAGGAARTTSGRRLGSAPTT